MLKHDKWLSEKLGKESYRLTSTSELMTANDPRKNLADCEFIYGLVPTEELAELHFLESHGFNLVDTRISFEKLAMKLDFEATKKLTLRHAKPEDKQEVCEIAGSDFVFSRFHLDPKISTQSADFIKKEWIANFFSKKRGDDMLIAEKDGKVAGFLSILFTTSDKKAVIDLVCVSKEFQKQGIGQQLLGFFENEYAGCTLNVGTQIANIASIRCYTAAGFRAVESKYIIHRHQNDS
ncbi:MAG: hypothetical protein BA863_18800 [Desulfovibrio sp. S3730MH75]|nr:MAG: hypothetical protein BA863_18800 [Desulfovibrio sp. S3730MH75]